MSTRRRVWVSRGQNTLKKYSPPCQNHPVCPLDHACFVFGRSRRCNANFPHRNLLCVWTIVWGGRNMVPTGAWPILILRGVSQPTPNAPEVPRAIGLCLDISNAHIPKNVYIYDIPPPQNIRHLGPISPILGPKACLRMITGVFRSILAQRSSKIGHQEPRYLQYPYSKKKSYLLYPSPP